MPSLKQAAAVTALVLVIHAVAIFFDLYFVWRWFDIVTHFLGGYAMALLGLALWVQTVERVSTKSYFVSEKLFQYVAVIGFVALVGIAWEWHEFALDTYHGLNNSLFTPTQPSIPDTMADLFFDLLGGTCAWFIVGTEPRRKR